MLELNSGSLGDCGVYLRQVRFIPPPLPSSHIHSLSTKVWLCVSRLDLPHSLLDVGFGVGGGRSDFGPTPSESQAPLLGTKSIVLRWIFRSSELRLPTSTIATCAGRAKGFPLQPLVSIPNPLAEHTTKAGCGRETLRKPSQR